MKKSLSLLLVFVLSTLISWAAPSSLPDFLPVEGQGFWVTFLKNSGAEVGNASIGLELVASSRTATTITVQYTQSGTLQTYPIAAGGRVVIPIDKTLAYNTVHQKGSRLSVRVTAGAPISLYATSRAGQYYESTYVLPDHALGTEYMVQTERENTSPYLAEYAVIATENGTELKIEHREQVEGTTSTTPALVTTIDTVMNAGDVYFVRASASNVSLSGTAISANKNVAVFEADEATTSLFLPTISSNHTFEQAIPVSSWGKAFLVSKPTHQDYTIVRISAVYENTTVTVVDAKNGTTQQRTLPKFSTWELPRISNFMDIVMNPLGSSVGDLYITADYPIAVQEYLTAAALNTDGVGTSTVAWVAPLRQGLSDISFTPTSNSHPSYATQDHYVDVVVNSSDVNAMVLDGAPVSASAFTAFAGTPYSVAHLPVSAAYHHLENTNGSPFMANVYGYYTVGTNAYAMAYAAGFNNVMAAPEVYIDGDLMENDAVVDYCNRHPGINFKAKVDYPHDAVLWDFGDHRQSSSMDAHHMYDQNLGSSAESHDIKFYVYRTTPIAGVKDTDSVHVTLLVHPTYYDTLRVSICGKEGSYLWDRSSKGVLFQGDAFKTENPAVKHATTGSARRNPATGFVTFDGFTKTTSTTIFDSVYYLSNANDCDSIFYIELKVTSEIVKPAVSQTVCQKEDFAWANHNSAGMSAAERAKHHLYVDGSATELLTAISTENAGTFVIRDSMLSVLGCDSIETLNLTVYPKPTMALTNHEAICQVTEGNIDIPYTTQYAATYDYTLYQGASPVAGFAKTDQTAAASGNITINTSTLLPGDYTLKAIAKSDKGCVSLEASATFTVKVRPTLTLNALAPICFKEATSVPVTYSSTNAVSYSYQLLNASSAVVRSATDVAIGTTYTIDVTDFPAGNYTLKMTVRSDFGCVSEEKTQTLTIYPHPTIAIGDIANVCRTEATVTVPYTTTDAATYEYRVLKGVDAITNATGQTAAASGSFNLSVSTWSAGVYTIKMTSKSANDCTSDEVEKTFEIYEKPTVTITAIADICYDTENVTTDYTTNTAVAYSWRLLNSASAEVKTGAGSVAASGTFTIPTAGLPAGTYTLHVTVASEHCTSDDATRSFKIVDLPTAALDPISEICYGENASASYTSTGAATYSYTVYQGATPTSVSASDVTAAASGTFTLATSSLAAGTYTLHFRTKSGVSGCESVDVTKDFVINPQPTLSLPTLSGICQTTTENIEVDYTATLASTYSWQLLNASSVEVASASNVTAPAGHKFTIATSSLAAGTYTLKMTVKSTKGCVSPEATTTLEVYPRPTLTINPISAICYGEATKATVSYSHTNGSKYSYTLYNSASAPVRNASNQPIGASFDVDVTSPNALPAGTYTLKMTVISEHDCVSEEKTQTLTIYPHPSITIGDIANVCRTEATVTVPYTTTDAATYEYRVLKGSTPVTDASAQAAAASGSFNLSVSTWSAGVYTIKMTSKSANDCTSDEVEKTFEIYEKPTVTITAIADICYDTENVTTDYTTTTAVAYSWRLLNSSSVEVKTGAGSVAANGTFTIPTAGLPAGTYTLHVTVASEHCTSDDATRSFKIVDLPTAALDPISEICYGENASASYTSTGAATYSYTVYQGATPTSVSASDVTAAASGTFTLATSSLAAGTYTLHFRTKSGVSGCESVDVTKDFVINPQPTLSLPTLSGICQTTTESIEVDYTATLASTYSWQLLNASSVEVASATNVTAPAGHKFTIATSSLAAGTYTLKMTVKSTKGCVSPEATTTLEVYPRPTLSLGALSPICFNEATAVTVAYTQTNAATYSYNLYNSSNVSVRSASNVLVGASYDINVVSPNKLPAGTYTLKMTVKSTHDCVSEEQSQTLTIYPQPTVSLSKIADVCKGDDHAAVAYTSTNAAEYSYEVYDSSNALKASATAQPAAASGSFNIAVSTWAAGTYTLKVTAVSANGCTSEQVTTTFIIRPTYEFPESATICDTGEKTWHGKTYKGGELGLGTHVITNTNEDQTSIYGCDSIYKLTLKVISSEPIVTTATICYGESYNWVITHPCTGLPYTLMKNLNASCVQYDTIRCPGAECNSVYKLDLTVRPENPYTDEAYRLCPNEEYIWHGQKITAAGIYTTTDGVDGNGCDLRYRLTATMVTPFTSVADDHICYGESYTFNGKPYSNLAAGKHTLLDTIPSHAGCDSIYLVLNLTVGQNYRVEENAVACDAYEWHGHTYLTSGDYEAHYTSVTGCDSAYVLHLTVNKSYHFTETYDLTPAQLPYTVHQFTYTAAGHYTREFKTISNCDSIYDITLNVHPIIIEPDTTKATTCAGTPYAWRDGSYTTSGLYSKVDGDSTHVLILNVTPVYRDTIRAHSCGEPVHGYSTTGIYTLYSGAGVTVCDSVVVLDLKVGAPNARDLGTVNACVGRLFSWGGHSFVPVEGPDVVLHATLVNASGCDSVLTLTVHPVPQTLAAVEDARTCEGEPYTWHGNVYTTPGTYFDTIASGSDCGMIFQLNLTVNPTYFFSGDVEARTETLPFAWRDTTLRTDGDYYHRYHTITGCDSIYHIHFHVVPVEFVTRDTLAAVTACDKYVWKGHTYTASGTYSDTIWVGGRYDKIEFLPLTINHGYKFFEQEIVSCDNEFISWHCTTYHPAAGYYEVSDTVPSVDGCDSITHTTFRVYKSFKDSTTATICHGETYNWRGQLLTAEGVYGDTLSSLATGCDSIYVLDLNVTTRRPEKVVFDTICNLSEIDWAGYHIANLPGGDYEYYRYFTPAGECETDSVLRLHVWDVEPDTVSAFTCYGEAYDWWIGDRHVQNGIYVPGYQYDTIAVGDCYKVTILDLKMSEPAQHVDTVVNVCAGADFTWHGHTFTEPNVYKNFASLPSNVNGCDSIVWTLTLTNTEAKTFEEPVHRCYGETYTWPMNGVTYTASADPVYTVQSHLAPFCDSLVYKLHLTIDPAPLAGEETQVVCDSKYVWNGITYTASGDYTAELTSSLGCDSTATLHLTLGFPTTTKETRTIKPSQLPYTWYEDTYTAAGTYTQNHINVFGCDSNFVLTLVVDPREQKVENKSICEGEHYVWHGWSYDQTGSYNFNTPDTIFTLNLTVNKKYAFTDTKNVCSGETFTWRGGTYSFTADDQVVLSGTSVYDCDSTHTLNVKVAPTAAVDAAMTICEGEVFNWGSYFEKPAAGTHNYTATFKSHVYGCDSTVNMTLTVVGPSQVNALEEHSVCDNELPYLWRGHSLAAAGLYGDTVFVDGCPSELSSLRLTVNKSFYQYDDVEMREGNTYTWAGHLDALHHDRTFTEEGTYFDSLHTVQGCDSVYELHLHLNFYQRDTLHLTSDADAAVCDTYTWAQNGETYTASGLYTDTVKSADPQVIHYLDLEIKNKVVGPVKTVEMCGASYVWHGQTLTASNTYVDTLDANNGCDSITTLVLTLHPLYSDTENRTVCANELPIHWHDTILATAGSYTRHYESIYGCDSTYTINLNVAATYVRNEEARVDQGESYQWHNWLTIPAQEPQADAYKYYHYFNPTPDGCDSVAILSLYVNAFNVITDTICHGDTYIWGAASTPLTVAGEYFDTVPAMDGGDSINKLILTVLKPTTLPDQKIVICPGSAFISPNGKSYTAAGTYADTLSYPTIDCDSIYRNLIITVSDTTPVNDFIKRFDTQPDTIWHGQTLHTPGIYTGDDFVLPNADGCDTRHIVSLQLFHLVDSTFAVESHCVGDLYTLNFFGKDTTFRLGAVSELIDTLDLVDPTKVDTIHHLHIQLPVDFAAFDTAYVARDADNWAWTWPGHTSMRLTTPPTAPLVAVADRSVAGVFDYFDSPSCDSIYHLNLHVVDVKDSVLFDTICGSQHTYTWTSPVGASHTITGIVPGAHLMANDSTPLFFSSLGGVFHSDTLFRYDTLKLAVLDTFATVLPDTVVRQKDIFEFCGSLINTSVAHSEDLVTVLEANTNGCDSTVYQHICIAPYYLTEKAICAGEVFPWHGRVFNYSVDTTIIAPTVNPDIAGCDTVYQLKLTVAAEPTDHDTVPQYASFLPITWRGHSCTEYHVVYHDTVRTEGGCDLDYFHTVFLPKPFVLTDTLACPGDMITWKGNSYAVPANDTIETTSSYLILRLRAHNVFKKDTTVTLYNGDPAYQWTNENGVVMRTFTTHHSLQFNQDTVFTSNVTGCDSIYHLSLLIIGDTLIEQSDTVCQGAELQTWTEASLSVLPDTLPTMDSLYVFRSAKTVSVDSVVAYKWNFFYSKSYFQQDYDTITVGDTAHYHGVDYANLGEGSHVFHFDTLSIYGCDSLFTDSLIVLPIHVVDTFIHVFDTICDGDIYTWVVNGVPVDPDGYYLSTPCTRMYNIYNERRDTLFHYDLTLSVRYATVLRTDTVIPFGGSLEWFDLSGMPHTFTTATQFRDTLHYQAGCDSLIQVLNLNIAPEPVQNILADTICQGEYYYRHGHVLNTSVVGDTTLIERTQAVNGADSIITFTLTVVAPGRSDSLAVVSPMDAATYYWNGYAYHAGMDTTFTFHGTTIHGCDSVASLRVTTGLLSADTTHVTLCSDEDSYRWQRQLVDTVISPISTGLYVAHQPTFIPGIDSVFVLSVKKLQLFSSETFENVCVGGIYTADTVVFDTVRYVGSLCDSLITKRNIHVGSPYEVIAYDTVPEGATFRWGNYFYPSIQPVTPFYELVETFSSKAGCDSTVTLYLSVAPKYAIYDTVQICLGDSYTWSETGLTYTPDRAVNFLYSKKYRSIQNMDSVRNLVLVVNPTYSKVENIAIAADSTLRWRSNDYNVAGTYTETLHSVHGCDSTFTLNLYVGRISTDTIKAETCEGTPYTWYGEDLTEQGLHYHIEQFPMGGGATFDSVLVLDLTLNPSYRYESEYVVPQDSLFVWSTDGQTYPTDVVGTFPLSASFSTTTDCDSLYFLSLRVEPTYRHEIFDTVCVLTELPNVQGIDSVRTEYLHTVAGFDSIVTHNLFIHGIKYVDEMDTTCHNSGFQWRGEDVSLLHFGDNFTSVSAQTAYGCDTIYELRIFIHPDTLIHEYDTIADSNCTGYHWRDTTLTVDLPTGDHLFYDSLRTIHGCDSVYLLHLRVRPTYSIPDELEMCDNDSVIWETKTFKNLPEGIYYDTAYFKTTPYYAGQPLYDSIRTLTLTVHPTYYVNLPDTTICPTFTVLIGDTLISEEGEHEITLHSQYGCDSICHIRISHFEQFDSLLVDTVCFATSYEWEDSTYYYVKGGTYTDVRNYTTIYGCDSIMRLQLTIENLQQEPQYEEACLEDILTWTRRRPISFVDSIDIEIKIYTPDTVGTIIFVDTIVTPLGCEYYDTLYIDVVEPVVLTSVSAEDLCPEEGVDLLVNFTVGDQGGDPREFYIYYSDAAKAQGFTDFHGNVTGPGYALVPTFFNRETFPQADTYEAELYLSNGSCKDTTAMSHLPFSFNVLYPSWFAEQHWNDMLAVLTPEYTASTLKPEGYSFVEYQWYLNGQPIDGAVSPMLYYLHTVMLPYGHDGVELTDQDEFQVLLTDSTGRAIFTCPFNPKKVEDHDLPQDFYFSVNPTVVEAGNPFTNLISNTTGSYTIFDAAGKRLAVGKIEGCEHNAMQIELPYVPGTYLLWMQSDQPSPYTGKIVTRTVKLLVY